MEAYLPNRILQSYEHLMKVYCLGTCYILFGYLSNCDSIITQILDGSLILNYNVCVRRPELTTYIYL